MIQLLSLTIENFKAFTGTHHLELPSSGTCLVLGANHDTGGSSGAGKSCLLDAIRYLCGFGRVTSVSTQSWNTDDKARVEGRFIVNGQEVTLSRGKETWIKIGDRLVTGSAKKTREEWESVLGVSVDVLEFLVDRPQKTRGKFLSMDDADKKAFLAQILKLDLFEGAVSASTDSISKMRSKLELLEGQLFQSQVSLDQLVQSSLPRSDLSSQVQDLEAKIATAKGELKELVDVAQGLQFSIDQAKKNVYQYKQIFLERKKQMLEFLGGPLKINLDGEPEPSEFGQEYDKIAWNRFDSEKELRRLNHELNRARSGLAIDQDMLQRELIGGDGSEQIAIDKAQKFLDGVKSGRITKDSLWQKLLAELAPLKAEWKRCKECLEITKEYPDDPMIPRREAEKAACRKKMLDVGYKMRRSLNIEVMVREQEALLEGLLKTQKDLIDQLNRDIAAGTLTVADYERRVEVLERFIAEDTAQMEQIARDYHSHQKFAQERALQRMEMEMEASIRGEELRITEDSASLLENKSTMKACFAAMEAMQEQLRQLQIQQAAQEAKIQAHEEALIRAEAANQVLNKEVQELRSALAAEEDFADMVGKKGFLGLVVEETLDVLSNETNQIMSQLPNVKDCSVRFETKKVQKNGAEKTQIAPSFMFKGNKGDLDTGASGGQESSIELASDLALLKVIEARTKVSANWMVLDEALNGLDPPSVEAALELIQGQFPDKTILLVEHKSEARDLVSKTLTVEHNKGHSSIGPRWGPN